MLQRHDIDLVRSDQFLCHPDEFASWAAGTRRLRLEDFLARNADRLASNYRMQLPLRGLQRLPDVPAIRARASEGERGADPARCRRAVTG
jgi:deoxyribodipyrimidine photolyase-like uncharacterized protein